MRPRVTAAREMSRNPTRIIFAVLKTGRPFDPDYENKRLAERGLAIQVA